MNKLFAELPAQVSVSVKPFTVTIPEEALQELQILLNHSPIAALTYESSQQDRKYGVTRKWLEEIRNHWIIDFDWRKTESNINTFPQFTTAVEDDNGQGHQIHFMSLFSKKRDAVPLLLLHGWPGSFIEFLPILSRLQETYSPESLPYNVIVPSLPGFAFSSKPPLDKDFTISSVAYVFNQLMILLGFENGYVVQGGDVGSEVARIMGVKYSSCKGTASVLATNPWNFIFIDLRSYSSYPFFIVNTCMMDKPPMFRGKITITENRALRQFAEFKRTGSAYALVSATRPSTIGFVLASSPLALLAWIGEKYLDWMDEDPPSETILEAVTLYWLTKTLPTSIFPYRNFFLASEPIGAHGHPDWYLSKPLGYSWFPQDIEPVPQSWVATTGNLVFYRQHVKGGHFAALEQPDELLQDIKDFINQVWVT